MTEQPGFDAQAYDDHYNMDDDQQRSSPYGTAMNALLERLQQAKVFDCLKRTSEFVAVRVEHDY